VLPIILSVTMADQAGLVTAILALGAAVGGVAVRWANLRTDKQSTILGATTSAAEALSAAAAALVTPLQDQLAEARERIRVLEDRDAANKDRIRKLEARAVQYDQELTILAARQVTDS
jgi:hypothetical protein